MTLANKLTLARLALALLTFGCLWSQRSDLYALALGFYALALLTDFIDGIVARLTRSISPFGAIADPVADKTLVLGALTAFVRIPEIRLPEWTVFLIIVRELVIGGLRALSGLKGKVLAADRWGKWAMAVQSVSVLIILMLLVLGPQSALRAVPCALAIVCLIASWISGLVYLYRFRKLIQKSWTVPPRKKA